MNINTTEFGVNMRQTVFNQPVEQSIDIDFYLPDYCPDITKILKCIFTPSILSKSVDSNRVTIDGSVTCCVIYNDNQGHINSCTYSFPFNKSFEMQKSAQNPSINAKIKIDYMNARAVSERRIEAHGAASILANITERNTKNVICDIDDENVFKKCGTVNAITPLVAADKHVIIEEEIDLGQGKPAINSIIRKKACAVINECKIISNKAVVKGDMMLKILYAPSPDGRPQCFETTLPFSQVVELTGVDEDCKSDVSVDVCSLEVDTKSGLSDEVRTLSVQAKLLLGVSAYCDNDVPVVFDVFSGKYEVNQQKEEVQFEKIVSRVNEKFICKKVLEFSDNSIGSVIDIWSDAGPSTVKCVESKVTMNGSVNIGVLGYDTEDTPVFYEKNIDYEYSFDLDTPPTKFRCIPDVKTNNISYNLLDAGRLEIRADIIMNAVIYDEISNNVVTSVEIETEKEKQNNSLPLILYYSTEGEEIWDIAKQYNASPEDISKLNDISGDIIENDKVLLIPSI